MLAWENPSSADSETSLESIAKEKEDKKRPLKGNEDQMHDDIPLFYSDIMPLLVSNSDKFIHISCLSYMNLLQNHSVQQVNEESSVGEDAFVWLASLIPLVADAVNAQFTFETLTATTASRLHFPAYDRFLKEMDKCIKYLEKQETPTGVELSENEFILHVEGTARTQRVVRHIGTTSWPGRLTLTNQALYFEANGVISYETAIKVDLRRTDVVHQVKATSTGPWGAPLFDKAITYESSELSEPLLLEFPEMTSSTRRDHWLTLIKEVILLHQFISNFNIESSVQAWETHARTILGVLRLHAARELLRISPPAPANFLIFSLYEDLPKGDYVLTELAHAVTQTTSLGPCNAASMLKSLNISNPILSSVEKQKQSEEEVNNRADSLISLETAIGQVREEAKKVNSAKATIEKMEEEGISHSLLILVELMSSLRSVVPSLQLIFSWERPVLTLFSHVMVLTFIYREWVGYAIAMMLIFVVGMMLWAKQNRIGERYKEIVANTSEKTTVESIVSAQHKLNTLHDLVNATNATILRIWSLLIGKAPKQANAVMGAMTGLAVVLIIIPLKYVLMGLMLYCFLANAKNIFNESRNSKRMPNEYGNRRLREWWESIPVIPVRTESSSV
ncbi:hypothetical protein Cni_G29460 [Canna indica]|uniref:Uncharacterized protein n=1 Tax=Canna indica TaxID=4628 RepID=A0AAQ3QU14_9LILI|nr:hypothetical protein Cni_G29460 [Canna indica]